MMADRRETGQWGENLAADYLQARGYRVCGRNVRTAYGEIDLILLQDTGLGGKWMVFVEVKTRNSTRFGLPEEAVGPKKAQRLLASAQDYLLDHPEYPQNFRIDVIAILRRSSADAPEIVHFENAVA